MRISTMTVAGTRVTTTSRNVRSKFQPLCALLVVAVAVFAGCRRNVPAKDETPDTSTYRPLATPATELEQKLKMVRDGGFRYVWVFTRHDGKEFTSEDSALLHANAPKVVDWVGMDDRKKFIAGSNTAIAPENLAELQKRYKIEDYSGK